MRVLVTGGTGLLGWWVARVFRDRGFEVYASFHSKRPVGLEDIVWIGMDLEDPQSIARVLEEVKPDIIVHGAAYTDVDGCEIHRDKAYRVNYLGTRFIAELSRRMDVYLVYISTDYVFDGERGFYSEDDVPNPVNYYGLTKLLGEVAVSSSLPDNSLIVRVSGLYGYSPTGKRNFGITALEKMLKNEEVKAFTDQYLSPTYVPFLAEKLLRLVERGSEINGVVHVAGERVSRYEFALLLARILGRDQELVKPTSMEELRLPARRPRDSSLDTSRAQALGLGLPSHEECIRHFIDLYKSMRGSRS